MKESKSLKVLSWLFALNVVLDYVLTKNALRLGGFVETNPFTNIFGLSAHMLVLLGLLSITYMYCHDREVPSKIMTAIIIPFNLWWAVNNYISWRMLT